MYVSKPMSMLFNNLQSVFFQSAKFQSVIFQSCNFYPWDVRDIYLGMWPANRSTQRGHPFVGRRNEYQPKGGDALRLGSKGGYGSCVGGR